MAEKLEIVVFSDDWFGLPFSAKHILEHFLPETRLIWVQMIGVRPPSLSAYDVRRVFQKLADWTKSVESGAQPVPENMVLVNPVQIPYNHLGLVRHLNTKLILRSLARYAPKPVGAQRVLITTWPFLAHITGRIGEDLSIYYRVDDFSEFPGVRREYLRQAEKELIANVDLVVATAEKLTSCESGTKSIRYLPHGVDFEHFAGARGSINERLRELPRPIIGFFGLINTWIDLDLIGEVAGSHPEWNFALIGPSQIPTSQLERLGNVSLLGPIPYEDLPACAAQFDVGLIPFRVNRLTEAVNPLKLLEYFALGLPVVSTPLPEVAKHEGIGVYVGEGAKGFAAAISAALAEPDPCLKEARLRAARANSWLARASQLREWIAASLEEKRAGHQGQPPSST